MGEHSEGEILAICRRRHCGYVGKVAAIKECGETVYDYLIAFYLIVINSPLHAPSPCPYIQDANLMLVIVQPKEISWSFILLLYIAQPRKRGGNRHRHCGHVGKMTALRSVEKLFSSI